MRKAKLLANASELTKLLGEARSELFHYDVRATYDTPEVADSPASSTTPSSSGKEPHGKKKEDGGGPRDDARSGNERKGRGPDEVSGFASARGASLESVRSATSRARAEGDRPRTVGIHDCPRLRRRDTSSAAERSDRGDRVRGLRVPGIAARFATITGARLSAPPREHGQERIRSWTIRCRVHRNTVGRVARRQRCANEQASSGRCTT
jgi:hypothetical protein